MRSGEMLGLTWNRVDFSALLVYFEAVDQKNGQVGSVPLNREAQAALESRARFREVHCPDSPWVFCDARGQRIARIKKSFASAVRQAGLENVQDRKSTRLNSSHT